MPHDDFPTAPFTASQAMQRGISRRRLRDAVESREVLRIVRGAYLRADVELTELVKAQAAALVVGSTSVLCDRTAAWIHGVDCLDFRELDAMPPLECCVLRGHEPTERDEVSGGTRDLRPEDITEVRGVRVTTPLRTAADLLCCLPRRQALAAADELMRQHGFTVRELKRLLVRYFRRRGVVQARQLAAIVDGGSESTGESWARLEIVDHGLPTPTLQYWVCIDSVPTYRLDLAYPRARVAVEYDGQGHHTSAEDRARDEERRAWLKRSGWVVIVLTKDSFTDEAIAEWIGELRQALAGR